MKCTLSLPDADAFWYLNSLVVRSFASCPSNLIVGEPLAKPISQTLLDACPSASSLICLAASMHLSSSSSSSLVANAVLWLMPKNPDATNNIARTTAVVVVVIEADTVFLIFIILTCGAPIYYRLDNLVNSHY